MSPLQGAIALHYVRRQYILDLVRYFLHAACVVQSPFGDISKQFILKLADNQLQKTLDSMKAIEQIFVDLDEKEKRGQFLGQMQDIDFVQVLKLRRDFLHREHDMLGQVLCGLIENKITPDDFFKIITAAENHVVYDTIFIHYVPAILVYSSALDPVLSMTNYNISTEEANRVHKRLITARKEWKLPYGRGATELIFLSYYAGMCRSMGNELPVDYHRDVLEPVRGAIDDGALELLMAIASDVRTNRPVQYNDYKLTMQPRVPFADIKLSDEFLGILTAALERLIESIISNLADILKEMRLSEEDSYMAMAEDESLDDVPGVDLERFFLFVAYLYEDNPESAAEFWNDSESNLYGFIQWASQCQVSFMAAAFCDMLASLATGQECANAVHRFMKENVTGKSARKTTRVTWEYVFKSFYYYIEQLKPASATATAPSSALGQARIMLPAQDVPDLDNDAVTVLKAYFRLLGTVAKNDGTARDELFHHEIDVIKLLFSLIHTQTPLIGSVLDVVSCFALTDKLEELTKLWEYLDSWAFNTTIYSPDGGVILPSIPAKDRLYNILKSFDHIVGLVTLVETLMRVPDDRAHDLYTLPYPEDLGSKYRSPGVWPYVDFLINEVFLGSSGPGFDLADRLTLQVPCLLFIKRSLKLFDPDMARLGGAAGVNPDKVVKPQSFLTYLKVHPCASTMTHLFDDKIYNLLISLASTGVDEIGEKKPSDPLVQVVQLSLDVINLVLDLQVVFIDIIVNEFKFGNNDGGGPQFSIHGLRSFEDALLFNLPIVSHLALYAGLPNLNMAHSSLRLLERLSSSPQFLTTTSGSTLDSRIKKNRLLSTLETVDESIRIKEGFIEQLERDVDLYEGQDTDIDGIQIKLGLLKFLISNLKMHSKEPTIAHFLLGFKVNSDGSLSLDAERGGINSEVCLLQSVLSLLEYAIGLTNAQDIELKQSELASACSEIVLLLTENDNSCLLILEHLRENDFMLKSLQNEPVIDSRALWQGHEFAKSDDDAFFLSNGSAQAMTSFFTHRMAMLEYFSVEIHVSAEKGALSLVSRYLDALVNLNLKRQGFQTARILSYLDVLEFQAGDNGAISNSIVSSSTLSIFGPQITQFFYNNEYDQDPEQGESHDEDAVKELTKMLELKGLEFVSENKITSLEDPDFVQSTQEIIRAFAHNRALKRIRYAQISCLIAWCKLVLILVNDTELGAGERSTFILETFQTIVPKLVDYSSRDIEYAEQLASLCVSLYKIYQADVKQIGQEANEYDRTYALFRGALSSMQTPLSTPELRADLYVVCYQYLKSCMGSERRLKQNVQTIRGAGDKLLETVCTDAISGEGVPRLTALVLLEVLCMVATSTKSTFLLDGLVRYNLLLLVVRSIKRIDNEISNRQQLSEGQFFYEISVFKATLCFLLQVATTRPGANQMIQCGMFSTLESCNFLKIDPDVGLAGSTKTFYELLIPVFQVVSALLLSMGPENEPTIARVGQFMDHHQQLMVTILKKEVVLGASDPKLQDLVKLLVLLTSLTQGNASSITGGAKQASKPLYPVY